MVVFHCHANKIKNGNLSIQKVYNLRNERRQVYRSLAKNQVCVIFHMRDIQKNVLPKFIKLCLRSTNMAAGNQQKHQFLRFSTNA